VLAGPSGDDSDAVVEPARSVALSGNKPEVAEPDKFVAFSEAELVELSCDRPDDGTEPKGDDSLDAEVAPANSEALGGDTPDDNGEPMRERSVVEAVPAKSVALSGDKPDDDGEPKRE